MPSVFNVMFNFTLLATKNLNPLVKESLKKLRLK